MGRDNSTSNLRTCTVTQLFAWMVFVVGLISNTVLIYFVLRKLSKGKRNDKLLLLNIITSNFLSCCGSLPWEILSRGSIVPQLQNYCLLFHQINFIALFTNMTSMSVICFDRYENVVKFPGRRLLSFNKTTSIIVVGWVLSLVFVPSTLSGFFVANSRGHCVCDVDSDGVRSSSTVISFFAMIVLVAIWITVASTIINRSLSAITSKLKKHRREVEQVLVIVRTRKEINLKRQSLAMIISYSLCWIPLAWLPD